MNTITISGKRIKEIREKNHFSQQNIAMFLGVDQSFISKVEKDERSLSSDMLEKLASLFGVQIGSFIEGGEEKSLSYAFRASDLTQTDMETIMAINKIALNSDFLTNLLSKAGE